MEENIIESSIYKEIVACKGAFDNAIEGTSDRERQRVKRGKLLLKLLSTIGSEDFLLWLRTADSSGYFYDFKEYKIVKRNTFKKDIIDLKELPKIIETAEQCFGKDINGNQLFSLLLKYDLSSKGYDIKDARMLIPAITVLLGKLANIIYKPQYQVGEIYYHGDMIEVVKDASLINLYMMQSHIETEKEAIDELCAFDWINISEDIFQEVKFDKRTRWSNRSITYGVDQIVEDPTCEYIRFRDREQLLGNVLIDENGIVAPQTFWSKNLNYPGRPLEIPFPGEQPLWNLDLIKGYGRQVKVFLTDSLLTAYHAYKEKQLEVEKLNHELEILKQKDCVSYHGGKDGDFENELKEHVIAELGKKYPNFETSTANVYYEQEYSKARMIFRLNGYTFNFARIGPLNGAVDPYADNIDKLLYVKLQSPMLHESNEYLLNSVNQSTAPNGYAPPCFNDYYHGERFKVFCAAYEVIAGFIAQSRKNDEARINEIGQQLAILKEIVWSSWYGGKETIDKVDWYGLKNRHVFYIIRKHDKVHYETAIRCYLELKDFDSVTLNFVDYETLLNNPEYEGISAKEFIESIPPDFNIDINVLKKKTVSQSDPMSFPDTYDPEKDDKEIIENTFLLSPLILDRSITLMYSEQGSAKTWIALSLANAMLHGCSVFGSGMGWLAHSPKRVLFIDSEMSNNSFKKRLSLLNPIYKKMAEQSEHGQPPFNLEYKQVAHEDWDLTDDDGEYRDKIYKWLKLDRKDHIDCLILDNLSTLSRFNDSGKSWSNLFGWLKNICEKGCACIVLHHANKTTGDQRGSSIKSATVDNIIRIKKALPGRNNNIAVSIAIEKARDAFGKALDPFNVMLKFNKDGALWTSTMANGIKTVSNVERNKMMFEALDSGAFSQKLIADYFGIDVVTLKGIAAKEKEKQTINNHKKVDQIFELMKSSGLNSDDESKLKKKLSKIVIAKENKEKQESHKEEEAE